MHGVAGAEPGPTPDGEQAAGGGGTPGGTLSDVREHLGGPPAQSRANRRAPIRTRVRPGARSAQARTNGRPPSEPPPRHRRRGASRSSRAVPAPRRDAPERAFLSPEGLPFARICPNRARHPARDAPVHTIPSPPAPGPGAQPHFLWCFARGCGWPHGGGNNLGMASGMMACHFGRYGGRLSSET